MSISINRSNVYVWNRVSTLSQNENYSLEMQEKICRDFINSQMNIKVIKRVFNNTGSGYNISNELKEAYSSLHKLDSPVIVCLSVDRFCRNFDFGSQVYKKIKAKGGKMLFILDRLDTSLSEHENVFFERLRQAETESKLKSERMKTCYQFNLDQKIFKAGNELVDIYIFIKSMIEGDTLENIFNNFRKIVDWKLNPDWEVFYQAPIEFDNVVEYRIGNKMVQGINRGDISYKAIASILNDYQIKIPIQKTNFKKWNENLVEKVYESKNNVSNLFSQFFL